MAEKNAHVAESSTDPRSAEWEADMLRATTEALLQCARAAAPEVARDLFRQFMRQNPPEFHGEHNHVVVVTWLERISGILDTLLVMEDALRVTLASYQLIDEAEQWWRSMIRTHPVEHMTWTAFTELYLEEYYPEMTHELLKRNFLNLQQGEMTVAQYEARFTQLSRFAPDSCAKEAVRAKRFGRKLKRPIRTQVPVRQLFTMAEMVERATMVEADLASSKRHRESESESEDDRRRPRQQQKHHQIIRPGHQPHFQQGSFMLQRPSCRISRQLGSTRAESGACFICGQRGHMMRNCTRKKIGSTSRTMVGTSPA